jgi:hypothetical protein
MTTIVGSGANFFVGDSSPSTITGPCTAGALMYPLSLQFYWYGLSEGLGGAGLVMGV